MAIITPPSTGLTRPRQTQLQTNITEFNDPLLLINKGEGAQANDGDIGFVFDRGTDTNVALIWDESSDQFAFVNTSEDGSTDGNVSISSYADISVNSVIVTGDLTLNDADDQIIHGDTQYKTRQYVLYGTTTNNTETELYVGGTASSRITVPTDTTIFYEVQIAARRTDATGESAGWHLKAVADNFSDTVTDVGSVYEVQVATDDATWAVDARADNTNNSINIYVTGAAGKTVRWVAVVKTMEVSQ